MVLTHLEFLASVFSIVSDEAILLGDEPKIEEVDEEKEKEEKKKRPRRLRRCRMNGNS